MSEDIRVLLVKLADRLHNMRTLHFLKDPEKRRRIARETMEIYAPLAERIGMQEMQGRARGSGLRRAPSRCARQHRWRGSTFLREKGGGLAERIIDELQRDADQEPASTAEVSGREKTPYSIWRKMQRKNVGFEQLSDIMAFRVVVDYGGADAIRRWASSTAAIPSCPAASRTTSRRPSPTTTARCTPA